MIDAEGENGIEREWEVEKGAPEQKAVFLFGDWHGCKVAT